MLNIAGTRLVYGAGDPNYMRQTRRAIRRFVFRMMVMALLGACTKALAVDTGRTREFEGIGIGAIESEAANEAYQNAMTALFREEFQIAYSVSETIEQGTFSVYRSSQFRAEAGEIQLDGVKLVSSSKRTLENGATEVRAKYAVSLATLSMAKKRYSLVNRKSVNSEAEMSIIGAANPYRANLVVETTPPGALVTIGESISLPSPLRLNGVLDPGSHTIRLDHPDYEPRLISVAALPGKTVVVREQLERAKVSLRFETTPDEAQLTVDGRVRGRTPVAVEVEAGQMIEFRIDHPDTNGVSKKMKVFRSPANQTVTVALEFKPTYLQIVAPELAGKFEITRGFRTTEIPRGKPVQFDPGDYKVCFEPFSKEVSKEIACGGRCCKPVSLKPGRLNIIGFHQELRAPTSVAPVRELKGEELSEKKQTEKVWGESNGASSAGSGSSASHRNPFDWPKIYVTRRWSFEAGVDSIQIAKRTVVLGLLSTGLRFEFGRHIFAEGAYHWGLGESKEATTKTIATNIHGPEAALGLQTSPENKWVFSVDYRVGRRVGHYKLEEKSTTNGSTQVVEADFLQVFSGPSIRIGSGGKSDTGFVDVWAYQDASSSKQVRSVSGVRMRLGVSFEF
ncbi:MAG: PEGA domain-containing protein [Bdellovibrionales bacterium]|nr:PEGA domain-containing protein [Bdellovibrionales bacterium]